MPNTKETNTADQKAKYVPGEMSPPVPSALQPPSSENPYLLGNFGPVLRETTAIELRTLGRIPEELEGRLVRIGPCPIGPRDPAVYHWFTGTGLVHGLRLRGGRVEWYRSRFTLSADAAEALGKPPISGPGEPHLPVNTNVMRVGGRLYAVVEAGASPIELDNNLESIARSDFGGTLDGGFTAHPKTDPVTGETFAMCYQPGRSTLRCVALDTNGRAKTRANIPAPHGPMIHDVAFTRNFVIVLDLPVTFQPERAPWSVFPYFWNREQPSRVGLLPRNGDLGGLTWFETRACYVFHIVNAYEAEGGEVVVDVVRHPRIFHQDVQGPTEGPPLLVRWTLDRARGRMTESILDDHRGEFPRTNDLRGGQDYRYAYTAHWWGDKNASTGPAYKHDVKKERTEVHDFGPAHASLEPVFVPREGAKDEDDGYVMAYVFNGERNASDVVILSGQDFTGSPLAVVELPVRVPFGFHGGWFPD